MRKNSGTGAQQRATRRRLADVRTQTRGSPRARAPQELAAMNQRQAEEIARYHTQRRAQQFKEAERANRQLADMKQRQELATITRRHEMEAAQWEQKRLEDATRDTALLGIETRIKYLDWSIEEAAKQMSVLHAQLFKVLSARRQGGSGRTLALRK